MEITSAEQLGVRPAETERETRVVCIVTTKEESTSWLLLEEVIYHEVIILHSMARAS